ncbi:hypothetical protein JXA85_05635 [Candidatus Woesearchaeota archaeon]|nr:hypothetical protein [Candidatus Woesearchaeota archaeon]
MEQIIKVVTLNKKVEGRLLERIDRTKGIMDWYCRGLGIPAPVNLSALIQEEHGKGNHLFQHPTRENIVVMNIGNVNVVYDRTQDLFKYYLMNIRINIDGITDRKNFKPAPALEEYLRKVIDLYDSCAALPKFSKKLTYEMEFGKHNVTGEPLVYQFKPFRKKEKARFSIQASEGDIMFDFSFGITPERGNRLSYVNNCQEGLSDCSSNYVFLEPSGHWESKYPHVACPKVRVAIFPILHYSFDHAVRESLMKIPIVLWGESSSYSESPDAKNVFWSKHSDKIKDKLPENIIVYSDGIKGKIVLVENKKHL